jgi:hypothetical protein
MTTPSHLIARGQRHRRRTFRRLSRRYADVGVNLSASRLAEIAAGGPATDAEQIDSAFADTATRILAEQRRARYSRARRRCVHSAVVLSGVVVALTLLVGLGLLFFVLAEHASPF